MRKNIVYALMCCVICALIWNHTSWRSMVAVEVEVDMDGEVGGVEIEWPEGQSPEEIQQQAIEEEQQEREELGYDETEARDEAEQTLGTLPAIDQIKAEMETAYEAGDSAGFDTAAQQLTEYYSAEATLMSDEELQAVAADLSDKFVPSEGPSDSSGTGAARQTYSEQLKAALDSVVGGEADDFASFGTELQSAIEQAPEKTDAVDAAYARILSAFDSTNYQAQAEALAKLSDVVSNVLGSQTNDATYRVAIIEDRVNQIDDLLNNPDTYDYQVNELDGELKLGEKIPDDQRLALMEDATINVFGDVVDVERLNQLKQIAINRSEIADRAFDFIEFITNAADIFANAEVIQGKDVSYAVEDLPQEVISKTEEDQGWLSWAWEGAKGVSQAIAEQSYEQVSQLVTAYSDAVLASAEFESRANSEFLTSVGQSMQQVGDALRPVPDYLDITVEYMDMTEDMLTNNKPVKAYVKSQKFIAELAVGKDMVNESKTWLQEQWAQGKDFLQNPWVQTIAKTAVPAVVTLADVGGKVVEQMGAVTDISDIQQARDALQTAQFKIDFKQGSRALEQQQNGEPSDPTINTSRFSKFVNKIKSVASDVVDFFKTNILGESEPTLTQSVTDFETARSQLLSKLNFSDSATQEEIQDALAQNPNIQKEVGNLDSSLQQMVSSYEDVLEGLDGISANYNMMLKAYSDNYKYELDDSVAANVEALLRMRDEQLIMFEVFDEGVAQLQKDLQTLSDGQFAQPTKDMLNALSALSVSERIQLLQDYQTELQKIGVELDKKIQDFQLETPEPSPSGDDLFGTGN